MTTQRSRWLPRLSLVLGGTALVVLLLHFAGIGLLRYVVERELHPALPRGTYIGEVHLNLLTGVLAIEDLELRNDGELRIRVADLAIDIAPWGLLGGELDVQHAAADGVYVRVDRRPDGTFDLGLPPMPTAEAGPADTGAPLVLNLAGIALSDVVIDYRDGDLVSEIDVDALTVGSYDSTAATQQVPIDWQMRWDGKRIVGAAVVDLAADTVAVRGHAQTDLLDLARAQQLARLEPQLRGEVAFDGTFDWAAPHLAIRGALEAPGLDYAIAGRRVSLSGIGIPAFDVDLTTSPDLVVTFAPQAGSRVETWEVELEGQRVTGRTVGVSGVLRYAGTGSLDTRDLDYRADEVAWHAGGRRLRIGGFELRGRVQQDLTGDTPIPALNARLAAATIEYDDGPAAIDVTLNDLRIDDLALSPRDDGAGRQLGGSLNTGPSRIARGESSVAWDAVSAVIGGQVSRDAVALRADVDLVGIEAGDPLFESGPLAVGRVAAQVVALGAGPGFERLRIEDLDLPSRVDETRLTIASIDVDGGAIVDGSGVAIGQVVIDGLKTGVIRDGEGQWRYPMGHLAGPGPVTPSTSEPVPADVAGSPVWRVAGLKFTGDSQLLLADHLNPDMQAPVFRVERLEIGPLASDRPDADTPFAVTLRPDQYSEFVFEGRARPLAGMPFIEAEGHLHGFGLTTVNGLIANDLGHRFLDGQLDNDFTIRIADNRLDMGNALGLAEVEVEEIAGKEGPPLATAIALLEDRDGNIKLEVPVSGDLDDPDFRVLGALNPIIMKAVAGTAALAIQPLGSVLLVGGLLADQALKVTFQPVVFEPGATTLDAAATAYLAELAAKLQEKPKLALRVCGVAVAAERRKDKKGNYLDDEQAMLAMAQRRADTTRAYLQAQGAGRKQLRTCRPAYEAQADAGPRVDIRF